MPKVSSKAIALVASLIVLIAVSIVVDRLGAPPELIRILVLVFSAASIITAGAMTRTVRASTYLLAAHRLGWARTTTVVAIPAMALAGLSGWSVLAGGVAVALGIAFHALVLAAPLRRSGAAGLGSFALGRYRSRLLGVAAGLIVAAIAGLLALFAGQHAVAQLLPATGLPEPALRIAVAALALLLVLPGGYASLAAGCVILALLAGAAVLLPAMGLWVRVDGSFPAAYAAVAQDFLPAMSHAGTAEFALVFSGLLVMLATAATARDAGMARKTHVAAALAVVGLSCGLAFADAALSRATGMLGGAPLQSLPAQIYTGRAQALVEICGQPPASPVAVQRACAPLLRDGVLPPEAVTIKSPGGGLWMAALLALPTPFGVIFALTPGLFLLGALAAAARAAAAGLINEGLFLAGGGQGSVSGRLALNRLVTTALVAFAVSGQAGLARLQPHHLHAVMLATAALPLALFLPALLRSADGRTPALSMLAVLGLAAAEAAGVASLPWQMDAAILLGVLAASLALFRSRQPEDAHAADVLAGRQPGPLLQNRDA